MGLDINGTKFLLFARQHGVDFARTATIGRQTMLATPDEVRSAHAHFDQELSAGESTGLVSETGFAETFLTRLGARHVDSFDASGYEQATVVHDFNNPIGDGYKETYSVVLDGGTLEHVFDYPTAIKSCMQMVAVGGHFLSLSPANNQFGHGFYQFSPELFYRIFSPENGFILESILLYEESPDTDWFEVADPEAVGERVTLTNSRPAMLALIARKTRAAEIFARPPQQSDYAAAWATGKWKVTHASRPGAATPTFPLRVWKAVEWRVNSLFGTLAGAKHIKKIDLK